MSAASTGLSPGFVTNLIVEPGNTQIIYASVEGNGVYVTTNGGQSWKGIDTGLPTAGNNPIALDYVSSSTLYAGTTAAYATTNGGTQWNPSRKECPCSSVDWHFLLPVPTHCMPAHSWVASSKSTDAGSTWSNQGLRDQFIVKADPTNAQVAYAATQGGMEENKQRSNTWGQLGAENSFCLLPCG